MVARAETKTAIPRQAEKVPIAIDDGSVRLRAIQKARNITPTSEIEMMSRALRKKSLTSQPDPPPTARTVIVGDSG
jgi:hypothetical protein